MHHPSEKFFEMVMLMTGFRSTQFSENVQFLKMVLSPNNIRVVNNKNLIVSNVMLDLF